MLIRRGILGQRGDTLLEVTIALSIIAVVLISSFAVASKSFRLTSTARERVTLANEAQSQMEALRAFRDNHTWAGFLDGGAGFNGVLNGSGSTGCVVSTPCFHMESTSAGATTERMPKGGGVPGSVSTSYIEITAIPEAGSSPEYVDFVLSYGFENLGGGPDNTGHIKTRLTNLRFALATPTPIPPPPAPTPTPSGPTPTPPVACVNGKDIVLTMDYSDSMDTPYGGGQTRLDALKTVAQNFVEKSNLGSVKNHMALITFSKDSTIRSDFSFDVATLENVIGKTPTSSGTNFTRPLDASLGLLTNLGQGARSPLADKVVVFFTDGDINKEDTSARAKAAADRLRSAGVDVYVIGLEGTGTDSNLLSDIAANNGQYASAKSAADLGRIFNEIAARVACN